MSDLDRPELESRRDSATPNLEDLAGLIGNRPEPEREGLPQGYRMRADPHYVDQLKSRYDSRAIRLIPIGDVEAVDPPPVAGLEVLERSIALHGVLQPLLVRRRNGSYRLIAGRRRLAAATTAGLSDVPCLVHDADDDLAAALAEADNLREPTVVDPMPAAASIDRLRGVLRAVSAALAPIDASAALLRGTPVTSFQHRVASDLIQAHTWRAAWLARATVAGTGDRVEGRAKLLREVLDGVKAGFEPEARLTPFQLDFSVSPTAADMAIDGDLGALAISGGVFATLTWLREVDNARIEIHANAPNARTLKIEIVQRMVPVSADVVRALEDPTSASAGDPTAAIGLRAIKAFATQQGGVYQCSGIVGRGSMIQATVSRR